MNELLSVGDEAKPRQPKSHRLAALVVFSLVTGWQTADGAEFLKPQFTADARTVFLFQPDAKAMLVDQTGRFQPVVNGGSIVSDPVWGECLKLGEGSQNSINIRDDGKIHFEEGMTLDAWVRFDDPLPEKRA